MKKVRFAIKNPRNPLIGSPNRSEPPHPRYSPKGTKKQQTESNPSAVFCE